MEHLDITDIEPGDWVRTDVHPNLAVSIDKKIGDSYVVVMEFLDHWRFVTYKIESIFGLPANEERLEKCLRLERNERFAHPSFADAKSCLYVELDGDLAKVTYTDEHDNEHYFACKYIHEMQSKLRELGLHI